MQQFFQQLENRLHQPLPGEAAHSLMASTARANVKFKSKPNDATRQSAVLILFYPDEGALKLPLILRPVYDGVHSGQVALPGGRMEESDKNFIETALRESHEEIGINPDEVKILGSLSDLFVFASDHLVRPVVGYCSHKPTFNIDAREVDQLIEVPLDTLLDKNIRGITNMVVNGNIEISAPYFGISDFTVWGATAMILSELVTVIDEININRPQT
jgi:8-oxo-dGTP pyrophosphatase MutT (NUDIX family)